MAKSVLSSMVKETLPVWLGKGSWDGGFSWINLSGLHLITWVLPSGEPFPTMVRENVRIEDGTGSCHTACTEDGWKGHELRRAGMSMNQRRQRNGFFSRVSRSQHSPANPLILAQWEPCQSSDLEDYKIVDLY